MEARQRYEQDLAGAKSRISQVDHLLARLIWVRTLLFFAATACLVLAYLGNVATPWTTWLGWLSAGGFLMAIVWNEHVRLSQQAADSDRKLNERLIARMDRNWKKLPAQEFLPEVSPPMCSDDLDVAGECSLLSFLSLAGTHPGKARLQSWIAKPPTWKEMDARQAAVKALAPLRDLRLGIVRKVSSASYQGTKPYQLAEWAESPSWLRHHWFANLSSYLGPATVVGGAIALLVGILLKESWGDSARWVTNAAFAVLVLGALTNLLVTILWSGWIHGIFQQIFGEHQSARQYAEVFDLMRQFPSDGGLLDSARNLCTEDTYCAINGFHSLQGLVRLASFQHNPVLYLVYLALQMCFLWDLHVLRWMERWKDTYGPSVRGWFESLGDCEAVLSAATLADENPTWAYPEMIADENFFLKAKQLAHPLLPENVRVVNDVQLPRTQPLLLVTGSNMAGKSTFLRSIGINVLLSRTGGPVCASGMSIPIMEIASSIRVRDSLREGVSFFMAELLRLKTVVDRAIEHQNVEKPQILFLLDEILQGTNSRERQIAVARVVEQLVKFGACGLLSTHDLDLAGVPEVVNAAQIVHFRETFQCDASGKEVMRFDYVMRPGVTPTTNALKLLELVGLAKSDSDASSG